MNDKKEIKNEWIKTAKQLSYFTIAYNIVEAFFSVYLGFEENSIMLAGFGGDSSIEVLSALIVLSRFYSHSTDEFILVKEKKATQKIGLLFLLLFAIVFSSSLYLLYGQHHPSSTFPGMIISALSLGFMFFLWGLKKKVAKNLNSSTMMSDANCSLVCIKLSFILFAGSFLFWKWPSLWWVDSVAALIFSFFILKEGIEMIQATRNNNFSGGCGCQ